MRAWCWVALAGVAAAVPRPLDAQWKSYTAQREIRALATDPSGTIWAATGGGMFAYRYPATLVAEYTTSEGLTSIDLTAIVIDRSGGVWTGTSNGFLHRYFPPKDQWQYVADISLLTNPQKRINRLLVSGDTLFIVSDVGVSLFSVSRMEFIGTYARFGPGSNPIAGGCTSLAFFAGALWVGTHSGLVATPLTNPNPSAPDAWTIYTTADGLPSNDIADLVRVDRDHKLYVATAAGLAAVTDTPAVAIASVGGTAGLPILDAVLNSTVSPAPDAADLYFITPGELWSLPPPAPRVPTRVSSGFPSLLTALLYDPAAARPLMGSISNGVLDFTDSVLTAYSPPGPPSNQFVALALDNRGVVWSGTGSANGEGFMSFDGSVWRSYRAAQYPELLGDNYYKVSIGRDNAKWVSNWGYGVALLDDGGSIRRVYNTTNGIPPSINPNFVVVGGVAVDANGLTWITNRTGPDDTSLVVFHPDSSLTYVLGQNMRGTTPTVFNDVVIDQNGTKWFGNFSRFEPVQPDGVYFYNENFALPGSSGGWGRLTTSNGLTTNKAWSVAVDRDGSLWIGSDEGITIVFDPGNPFGSIASYHPLPDQIIQGIVVDALNNKWIATQNGVFLLNQDGTAILDHMTVQSTQGKLLDDDVASLAMNGSTGAIYFGTEKGLSSLATTALTPRSDFDKLRLSPNPLYLPTTIPVTIDGLVEGSSVKILSTDGRLVRELQTPGGRIGTWDGRNARGELVATAVYLVVAYSEDGTKVATAKLAVIRR